MNIISMKVKGKNTNIFIVKTDSEEYIMHSDIIVKFGICKGLVAEERFKQAVEESTLLIATNTALNYLNQHNKSEKQVKDYLYKKGYKSTIVNAVCIKLKEYNLFNDKTYVQSYINSNLNFSKRKLKQKLQGFGIKNEDYETFLNEIDELPACVKEVDKFFKNRVADKANTENLCVGF